MRDAWLRSSPCPQYRSERIRQQLRNWVGSWVGRLIVQSLQVIEGIGRGEWIRTTDLLVPNQEWPAISPSTHQICSYKTSI
jgi:hypothetical protein